MTISPLPPAPSRSDGEETFAAKADPFLAALPPFGLQLEAFRTQVEDALPLVTVASAVANYQGDYDAGTSYTVGQTVTSSGILWQAKKTNLGIAPADGADWREIVRTDVLLTDVVVALTGTAPVMDLSQGTAFTLTTSGTTTLSFANATAAGVVSFALLEVVAGGEHGITWPAEVEWREMTSPPVPASGQKAIYAFLTLDGGTSWTGIPAGWNIG